jgi:hypothetical protein
MNPRLKPLVTFTIAILAIYAPIETLYSLPRLWDPFYLVDFIGMALLAWGVLLCRRGASQGGLAVLTAAYGWLGANFWRALFGRVEAMMNGESLRLGWAEMCFVGCGTAAALAALAWALTLAVRARPEPAAASR